METYAQHFAVHILSIELEQTLALKTGNRNKCLWIGYLIQVHAEAKLTTPFMFLITLLKLKVQKH